jgi:hypothetical protein
MSQSQTSGYDILVQLSEQQLNALMLQYSVPLPPGVTELTFLSLELDGAAASFVSNGVRLSFQIAAFGNTGTVDFVAKFDVQIIDGKRTLGIYTVSSTAADSHVTPSFPNAPAFEPIFKGGFEQFLLTTPQPLVSLATVDPSSGSTDPLTPTELHVKVIDDPAPLGIDCVTLMVNTGGSSGGNAAGVTQYLGNGPDGAVVTLSNQLLLERLIRLRLESAIPGSTFNPPCVLANQVEMLAASGVQTGVFGIVIHALDMHIVLQSLSVGIEGDHLLAAGSLGGSGAGFSASGSFSIRLYIVLRNGALEVDQYIDTLDADVHFEWWVYLLTGLAAGPVQALLLWWVQSAMNRGIDGMLAFLAVVGDQLGVNSIAVPAIPLGVNGGQLTIQSVLLDDLTLQGPVTRTPAVAAGLAIQGDLHVSHTDSMTLVNGVPLTGILLLQPGLHIVTTRKFAYRGLFSAALSQPVFPATFVWSWGGTPISGTGMRVVSQEGAHGIRDDVTTYFQVEGAHCWIWTPVGTTLVGQHLSLTLIDGAGHHSTASRVLSCDGITVTDFITQPLIGHVISDPGADPSHVVATATVEWLLQNPGVITPAIDRKRELSAAFQRGLTAKRDSSPAAGRSPPDKPTTTR